MSNENVVITALFILFFLLGGLVVNITVEDQFKNSNLLSTCQQSLPRDQICVLVAIPKKEL